MQEWQSNQDPRLSQYDFCILTRQDIQYWYGIKQRKLIRRVYGAFDDRGVLLGFMTLKRINPLLKRAYIGIAFDPAHHGQGVGTEALSLFVERIFSETKLQSLCLEVALFNTRAARCYNKVGFRVVKRFKKIYESQENAYRIIDLDKSFYMKNGMLYTHIDKMQIRRGDFIAATKY